jgi:hypothetical protein
MLKFLESHIGQIIARNGILAVILAWALWKNDNLTERLFQLISNNTATMEAVKKACGG